MPQPEAKARPVQKARHGRVEFPFGGESVWLIQRAAQIPFPQNTILQRHINSSDQTGQLSVPSGTKRLRHIRALQEMALRALSFSSANETYMDERAQSVGDFDWIAAVLGSVSVLRLWTKLSTKNFKLTHYYRLVPLTHPVVTRTIYSQVCSAFEQALNFMQSG